MCGKSKRRRWKSEEKLQIDRRVFLDLQDVKYVDREGVEMLRRLAALGVEIAKTPPVIGDMLKE